MTQSPWEFLPDDDELDEPLLADGPEEAALHLDDAATVGTAGDDEETEERDDEAAAPFADEAPDPRGPDPVSAADRWLPDEEPDPGAIEPEASDADDDPGAADEAPDDSGIDAEADGDSDPEAEDLELLLERQHYAFAPGDDDVAAPAASGAWTTNGSGPGTGGHPTSPIGARRLRELLADEHGRLQELLAGLERDGLHEAGGTDSVGDLSHAHQHAADLGSETFEREVELSLAHEVEDELREVLFAIERIDAGRFGMCEACGEPIAAARLEVLPATRWCREHATGTTRVGRLS